MKVHFKNRELETLYRMGKSRKGGMPQAHVKRFSLRKQVLEAAITIFDLWKSPSLNFEGIKGFNNKFSLRVNDQYRLEIEIEFEDEERTRGDINIMHISDHYGGRKW